MKYKAFRMRSRTRNRIYADGTERQQADRGTPKVILTILPRSFRNDSRQLMMSRMAVARESLSPFINQWEKLTR